MSVCYAYSAYFFYNVSPKRVNQDQVCALINIFNLCLGSEILVEPEMLGEFFS